jgi:hypothetical protein
MASVTCHKEVSKKDQDHVQLPAKHPVANAQQIHIQAVANGHQGAADMAATS